MFSPWKSELHLNCIIVSPIYVFFSVFAVYKPSHSHSTHSYVYTIANNKGLFAVNIEGFVVRIIENRVCFQQHFIIFVQSVQAIKQYTLNMANNILLYNKTVSIELQNAFLQITRCKFKNYAKQCSWSTKSNLNQWFRKG